MKLQLLNLGSQFESQFEGHSSSEWVKLFYARTKYSVALRDKLFREERVTVVFQTCGLVLG